MIAATTCRYLFWQRSALEYLFVKETYLATVLPTLVAKDITVKLYSMNNKVKQPICIVKIRKLIKTMFF